MSPGDGAGVDSIGDLLSGVPELIPTQRVLAFDSTIEEIEVRRVSNVKALRDGARGVVGLVRGVTLETDGWSLYSQSSDFLVEYRAGEVERVFKSAIIGEDCVVSSLAAVWLPIRDEQGAITAFDVRERKRSNDALCGDWGEPVRGKTA